MVTPAYSFRIEKRSGLTDEQKQSGLKARFEVSASIGDKLYRFYLLTDDPSAIENDQYKTVFKVLKQISEKRPPVRPGGKVVLYLEDLADAKFSFNKVFENFRVINNIYEASIRGAPLPLLPPIISPQDRPLPPSRSSSFTSSSRSSSQRGSISSISSRRSYGQATGIDIELRRRSHESG